MCAISIVPDEPQQNSELPKVRYTVDYGMLEGETKRYYIILDDGVPAKLVNQQLLRDQRRRHRSVSSDAYLLCAFLNNLNSDGLSFEEVTYDYLESYLTLLYVEMKKSVSTIRSYIRVIGNMFEDLALRHVSLHPSLLKYKNDRVIIVKDKGKITTIYTLEKFFKKRTKDILQQSSVYTKWYSNEQIKAVANALPLVDRCIFWDTILTGHRINSALSLQLTDFDPIHRTVYARYTKTGKSHLAPVPIFLVDMINTYIHEERSRIVERTGSVASSLFLNRDGTPRSYTAFYAALKRVEEQLKREQPELGIEKLHTHAGRSTFLARVRSYQLDQRRKGLPIFTDADVLNMMDWKSMSCLENYDLLTRAFEVLPFQQAFFEENYSFLLEAGGYARS